MKSTSPIPLNAILGQSISSMFDWLNADKQIERHSDNSSVSLDRLLPFVFIHLGCVLVVFVGYSPLAIAIALALYFLRMLAITAVYHRYFSHRAYRLNRFWQFLAAVWGLTAVQRGPLWWASHHRKHHRHSDTVSDIHSPRQKGFWWSHIGWMCCNKHMQTDYQEVKDFTKFPELVWLNRYDWVVPVLYTVSLYGLGQWLAINYPSLGTNGFQLVVWGGFISTVALFHGTVTINSLCHVWGKPRFMTNDDSKNNFWLALITLGEGWHNNHHFYPGSARQGFYWWEIDMAYAFLKCMASLGVVQHINDVPVWVYEHSNHLPKQTPLPLGGAQ